MTARSFLLAVLYGVTESLLLGCGASPVNANTPSTSPAAPSEEPRHEGAGNKAHFDGNSGSSDGPTCEDARASYVEELDMTHASASDLTAGDFAAVLNQGTYMAPCNVPAESRAQVCAAVRNGAAVGVTVKLDPPAPEIERCVAKEVRALTFPVSPKMDITVTRF